MSLLTFSQNWLSRVINKSGQSIKALCANSGENFISIKLRDFCEKIGITLKYIIFYIHEKNDLAERN